jgi:hypothetical protein
LRFPFGMDGVLLTVRIPDETRTRLRAISIVTRLPLHDVVVTAFEKFYRRLPLALQSEIDGIVRAQLRYHTKGGTRKWS